jgi:hypothetical protein
LHGPFYGPTHEPIEQLATLRARKIAKNPALILVLPLHDHRRRCRDHDQIDAPAQEKLARDQDGLDGLAEADIVGDQKIDPRQPQRLARWQ